MLRFILLILLMSSSFVSAGSHRRVFHKTFEASTEKNLVALVEANLPLIKNGSDWSARIDFRNEECWPVNEGFVEIEELVVRKIYKVNANGNLEFCFRGSLSFSHKNCK